MDGTVSGIYREIRVTVGLRVIIFSFFGIRGGVFFFRLRICSLMVMGEPVPVVNLTDIRLIASSDPRSQRLKL